MDSTHRVYLSKIALADLQHAATYIHQHSPDNAAKVAEVILAAIDSLETMPTRFKRVGVSSKRKSPVHSLVVRPFIIYYRVDTNTVFILTIRHGARRRPKQFE